MRSLWTAATGMVAQQISIDVTSNNLANVNTLGFKKSRAEFQDLMYQTMEIAGTDNGGVQTPTGMQIGMGVRPTTIHKFFKQGNFQNTDNQLDLAIAGNGFFLIDADGVPAYTRAGSFKLNSDGVVVTPEGYPLQPEFTVPPEAFDFVVTENGRMAALDKNGVELAGADLEIHNFINPAGLNAIGRNLYYETEASGAPVIGTPGEDNLGTIAQGFLEGSNVEMVEEMVNLIVGQRAFEMNSKAITTADSLLQNAISVKR